MYNILKTGSREAWENQEFVCATIADLDTLPGEAGAGSICYCFEDAKFYMKDFNGSWQVVGG